MAGLTLEALRALLDEVYPQSSAEIEAVGDGHARVRQAIGREHLRPGDTVSGPVLMAAADWAAYAAILGEIGRVPLAVTTNLSIGFLRKPAPDRAIVGEATLLKLGRRLAVAEVRIYSEGGDRPVAHAQVTYSIPPRGG